VFGSAFESVFAFQKAKSQPNTLAFQSCFSSSTKLKAAPHTFMCCGGGQLQKNYPSATFKKLMAFELLRSPHSTTAFPQPATFSKATAQPNTP